MPAFPRASAARSALLQLLAEKVEAVVPDPFVRVGVDGVDGAGKSVLADELAAVLRERGREVVRASVDGFHRPRALRYARGRDDPEGFYRDSHDLAALHRELLQPLGPSGHGMHRRHVLDVAGDRADVAEQEVAVAGAVLIVDGIFLHRPELRGCWSLSLWLQVQRATSLRRCVARDGAGSPDPAAASNRRYVEGQRLYVREAAPQLRATHVIDNEDLAAPVLLR
ncbi:uridine kinase [Kineococcus gypseus]|uniref:uridine kinase n=1 Tax=Kineococcus gypseus TaxID=1637102 RepID=UPI003D7E94C3